MNEHIPNITGTTVLGAMTDSPLYNRIGRIPDIIAGTLVLVLTLAFGEAFWFHWNVIAGFFGAQLGFVVGEVTAAFSVFTMKRRRVHDWLKDKFDSWEDIQAWFAKTPIMEINRVAALKNEEWEVK